MICCRFKKMDLVGMSCSCEEQSSCPEAVRLSISLLSLYVLSLVGRFRAYIYDQFRTVRNVLYVLCNLIAKAQSLLVSETATMATVLVDSQPASPDVFDTPLTRVHSWPRNKSRRALMGEQANEKLRASSPRDQKKDPRYHEDETSQYCLPNE